MNCYSIKKLILSLLQDVVFEYDNKTCCINPWHEHKFELGYGDFIKDYSDIDELMNDKIFNGKSLCEISNIIDIE